MKLFLVGGAGSGKDTVADYLRHKHNFKQYAIADYLRYAVEDLYGGLALPSEKHREIMQSMGAFFRQYDEECLCSIVDREIKHGDIHHWWASAVEHNVVISDIRLPYEWKYFFDKGYTPVHLWVDEDTRIKRLEQRDGSFNPDMLNDVTETERNLLPGYTIYNTTNLDDVYKQVEGLISFLGGYGNNEQETRDYWWSLFAARYPKFS